VGSHGTFSRYRSGCKCESCTEANREKARRWAREQRRQNGAPNPTWSEELKYEAEVHDVRALPRRRRLAMSLRRSAEVITYHDGFVTSPEALVRLLHVAAAELDVTTRDNGNAGTRGDRR
jgi:hypothetical protein